MIIDFHTHIGDLRAPGSMHRLPIAPGDVIDRLDDEGIDKAVVLPWPASPEAVSCPGLFGPTPDVVGQILAVLPHADRLIPFGNADARWGGNSPRADFSYLLGRFVEMGCKGMGEVAGNLLFDDPRVVNLFRQCGEWRLPVTIESCGPGEGRYGLIDEPGSPHLERLLQLAPNTTIIGHGPGFWAEIAADITPEAKSGYPSGPIAEEGSLARLFRTYPNLYADLSAFSGYNAITRDPEYGIRFLNEFQDRLLFGTDVCFADAEGRMPQLGYLRRLRAAGSLSQQAFDKITGGNGARLLSP